jgi:hypothetical protein
VLRLVFGALGANAAEYRSIIHPLPASEIAQSLQSFTNKSCPYNIINIWQRLTMKGSLQRLLFPTKTTDAVEAKRKYAGLLRDIHAVFFALYVNPESIVHKIKPEEAAAIRKALDDDHGLDFMFYGLRSSRWTDNQQLQTMLTAIKESAFHLETVAIYLLNLLHQQNPIVLEELRAEVDGIGWTETGRI